MASINPDKCQNRTKVHKPLPRKSSISPPEHEVWQECYPRLKELSRPKKVARSSLNDKLSGRDSLRKQYILREARHLGNGKMLNQGLEKQQRVFNHYMDTNPCPSSKNFILSVSCLESYRYTRQLL